MRRFLCGLIDLAFLLALTGQAKAGYTYTMFDVPGATNNFAYASGINDNGQIVGYFDGSGARHGFLLSGGSYTTLDVPGASFTQASAINNNGQIVGWYIDGSNVQHCFLATPPAPLVTCPVVQSLLWPADNQLVNVGLAVSVTPSNVPVTVMVYANDHAARADAADVNPGTLELRSLRQGTGQGRVYLIVATASSIGGTGFSVCTVAVPHDDSPSSIQAVQQQAAAAAASYRQFTTAPPNFALIAP